MEIAVDALDIAAIRPFWKAVLGYADEAGHDGPEDPLVDPLGQGPAVWFQRMGRPRPQRNRVHFDVCVPHDEAAGRVERARAAGGRLVSADAPPPSGSLPTPRATRSASRPGRAGRLIRVRLVRPKLRPDGPHRARGASIPTVPPPSGVAHRHVPTVGSRGRSPVGWGGGLLTRR
ncbi:VOC family protein [Streptantibioticus parmotrematis]|uniref:VOC family protein n=1 Tax=Streptantibioticus parmotrematis TaxID=2873249 RepID=UPI00207BF5F5|nr:VOC family protein [Streptantibioticus parmotrematis]